jgi:tetratricopeptide (TPR) repeat protein
MVNLDDTQPKRAAIYDDGIPAPPRFLLWGVVGLFFIVSIGAMMGLYIFREVLPPARQEHVMYYLPFMREFLPNTAAGNVPTAEPVDQAVLDSLLNAPLEQPDASAEATSEETPEITVEAAEATIEPEITPEATEQAAIESAIALVPTEATAPTQAPIAETASPLPTPTTQVPIAPASNRRVSHLLGGITRIQQDWNNCGPANITMALSYFGWTRDQDYAGELLKPEREDKNVSPEELAAFVNTQSDIRALTRIGGNLDLLRDLINNDFPVIVEVGGFLFGNYEWIGHYRTLAGYNDDQRVFTVYDSFQRNEADNSAPIVINYDEMDGHWRAFNRVFIVLYEPGREAQLMALLGPLADETGAAEVALEVSQQEANANRRDAYAWFNLGTALTRLGRYEEAVNAYALAQNIGIPRRMLWYQFGPFEANFYAGQYDAVLSFVQTNLENGAEYVEETYYWQGRVLAARNETTAAASAFRQALRLNRYFTAAQQALDALNA